MNYTVSTDDDASVRSIDNRTIIDHMLLTSL